MSLRTPLARVRGLGSAKEGTSHWIWQRVTALVLVPLGVWFMYSLLSRIGAADISAVSDWLSAPLQGLLMVVFCLALLYHAKLGIQVVVEDYVHTAWLKTSLLTANLVVTFILCVMCAMSVLTFQLAPGGGDASYSNDAQLHKAPEL